MGFAALLALSLRTGSFGGASDLLGKHFEFGGVLHLLSQRRGEIIQAFWGAVRKGLLTERFGQLLQLFALGLGEVLELIAQSGVVLERLLKLLPRERIRRRFVALLQASQKFERVRGLALRRIERDPALEFRLAAARWRTACKGEEASALTVWNGRAVLSQKEAGGSQPPQSHASCRSDKFRRVVHLESRGGKVPLQTSPIVPVQDRPIVPGQDRQCGSFLPACSLACHRAWFA